MTRSENYGPEIKAAAIAGMLAGESISHVAARLSVPVGTVKAWRQREMTREPVATVVASVQRGQPTDLGELVGDFLSEGLRTLSIHAVLARDPEWFKKQNAADLAVYDGVLADKLIRVLSALKPDG